VKLRDNGQIYVGRGLSTDIIESSIIAYINAVNKIAYAHENNKERLLEAN
jgi:2-isopropylmalate synthase